MPYYQKFKETRIPRKRKQNTYRHHHTSASLYNSGHRLRGRTASKANAVNPLIVKLSIAIFVCALLFGFIKSGANSLERVIKIGGKDKQNISSIQANSDVASSTPNEQEMSILRDLTFKIFAKPEGDDSVIHEVASDSREGGDDYISTIVRRSSITEMSNSSTLDNENNIDSSSNANAQNDDSNGIFGANSLIDGNTLRELFNPTSQNKTTTSSSRDDRIVINDALSYIPKVEFSDDVNSEVQNNINPNSNVNTSQNSTDANQSASVVISESMIASVLNQNDVAISQSGIVEPIIETKKFEEILAPRATARTQTSQRVAPARTSNTGTIENSTKEYEQPQNNVARNAEAAAVINNSPNYILKDSGNVENKINVVQQQRPSINANSSSTTDQPTTTPNLREDSTHSSANTQSPISTSRSEVLNIAEVNEQSEILNTLNKSLSNANENPTTVANSSVNRENGTTHNNQIQTSTSSSWNINIDRSNSINNSSASRQTVSRTVRGSKNKPSIFLAQYDERLGNITIIPKERNMNKNTTLEEAILTLLEGAKEDEYNDNVISLISRNTSLLDLFVDDDTVYLNFSDDFEYNPLGDEGIVVQIYQIVYTATQFEGINNVVFLIDGEQKEFIGSEGQILNKVFTRMEIDTIEVED